MGRFLALLLLASAVLAGGGMYYLQVYGYYRTLDPASPDAALTLLTDTGPVPLAVTGFEGIDSDSSPIRFRACARLTGPLPEGARPHPAPVPLTAPGWFRCFDARTIGEALERGEARAFVAAEHSPWGVDRVLALFPDGRVFVWPQINACGTELFDGKPLPEGCPPPPAPRTGS